MTDACVITRVTTGPYGPEYGGGDYDNGALNTATGDYSTSSSQLYAGKCRLRGSTAGAASVRELQAGEAEQPTYRYQLLLPHGSYAAAVGDVVSCDSRTFTVVGEVDATTTTAQALIVEEIQ